MAESLKLPREWLLRALDLETDPSTDAAALTRRAVLEFRTALEAAWAAGTDPGAARERLTAYAARLGRARATSPSVAAALDACVAALDAGRDRALRVVETVLERTQSDERAQLEAAATLFRPGARVITLGRDERVLQALLRYSDLLESVTVSEGRPLNAGGSVAAALGERALPVRLITEAQLELFVPESDVALAAAARVLPGGDAAAPVGTAVLARVCQAHRVPVYLFAGRSRWVSERDPLARFVAEGHAPSEVAEQLPGVEISNVAFDRTPADLITGYVTEGGVVSPTEGARTAAAA